MSSKSSTSHKWKMDVIKIFLPAVLLALVWAPCAYAVGTASSTIIGNRATINYSVGTVSQTPIESSPGGNTMPGVGAGADTTFLVDDRIDLTVSTIDGAAVPVTPGGSNFVLTFRVDNTGNTTHDFILSPTALTDGTYSIWAANDIIDNFQATNVRTYIDVDGQAPTSGYIPSSWDGVGTETPIGFIDELAADHSITVYIVVDIDIAQEDGDAAAYGLVAQAAAGGAPGAQGAVSVNDSGADDPSVVQIVFGDGIGTDDDQANPDGRHSSRSAYFVGSAQLSVTKSSLTTWDPVNLAANPKAIPGATVQYTIHVENAGSTNAATVIITDEIPVNTVFEGTFTASNSNGTALVAREYATVATPGAGDWVDFDASAPADPTTVTWLRTTHSVIDADTGTPGSAEMVFQVTIE